ncbi:hypothetical protein FF011L_18000 [Roseimaritima multifibrata]|uniref:Uncharacterized protein n=1 Tax=Roseimaritima multifibrata TaxID=1930274 RepID=A0A517MDT2_9BACT|nr:hypothetical protein FF011L_18000 [Roseimaritima multifibrata]
MTKVQSLTSLHWPSEHVARRAADTCRRRQPPDTLLEYPQPGGRQNICHRRTALQILPPSGLKVHFASNRWFTPPASICRPPGLQVGTAKRKTQRATEPSLSVARWAFIRTHDWFPMVHTTGKYLPPSGLKARHSDSDGQGEIVTYKFHVPSERRH